MLSTGWYLPQPEGWGGYPLMGTLTITEQESDGKSPFPKQLDVVFCDRAPGGPYQTVRELAGRQGPTKWKSAVDGAPLPDEGVVHVGFFLNGSNAPYLLLPVLPKHEKELKNRVLTALSPATSLNGTAVKNVKKYVHELLEKEGLHV